MDEELVRIVGDTTKAGVEVKRGLDVLGGLATSSWIIIRIPLVGEDVFRLRSGINAAPIEVEWVRSHVPVGLWFGTLAHELDPSLGDFIVVVSFKGNCGSQARFVEGNHLGHSGVVQGVLRGNFTSHIALVDKDLDNFFAHCKAASNYSWDARCGGVGRSLRSWEFGRLVGRRMSYWEFGGFA